jgi:hypothetical protein
MVFRGSTTRTTPGKPTRIGIVFKCFANVTFLENNFHFFIYFTFGHDGSFTKKTHRLFLLRNKAVLKITF